MDNIKVPKVSIIMPCYNHENYVAVAIESVLGQTYQNFEFIVADNGSTDSSGDIINTYADRIRIIKLEKNDPLKCKDMLWDAATGEYVAMICSDDFWYPEKLEKQVQKLEETNSNIIFTWAEIVDSNLEKVIDATRFTPANQSNAKLLRKMIENGTIFELSSLLIKNDGRYHKYYEEVSRFRQLPDYALYINMLLNEPVCIVEEYLVKHRWHDNNVSKPTFDTQVRTINELNYLIHYAWENMKDNMFVEAYSDLFENINSDSKVDIICRKILVYLEYGITLQGVGDGALSYCWDHYYNEGISELLEQKYNFPLSKIYEYSALMGSGLLQVNKYKELQFKPEIQEIISNVIRCNEHIINMPNNAIEEADIDEIVRISLDTMVDILGKNISWNFNLRELINYYQKCNNLLSQKIQKENFNEIKNILRNINMILEGNIG